LRHLPALVGLTVCTSRLHSFFTLSMLMVRRCHPAAAWSSSHTKIL